MDFCRFFRDKLEQMGYFQAEQKEDVLDLVRFTRKLLTIDLRKRPFVRDLLANDPFIGGVSEPSELNISYQQQKKSPEQKGGSFNEINMNSGSQQQLQRQGSPISNRLTQSQRHKIQEQELD